MNKKIALATGVIVILHSLGFGLGFNRQTMVAIPSASLQPTQASTPISIPTEFEASFEINTNGTKRIFTDPKYHRQSPEVYLTAENPSVIQVKKVGITWDDFFKTLPFSLTTNCLVTGTKQTFCTTATQKLRFFINGEEMPDALNKEIKEGDMLKVVF